MLYIDNVLKSIKNMEVVQNYFWYYLIIINCIGFLIMGYDKYQAKKGNWRTPEKTLMTIALMGGSLGTTLGMYFFRHKTRKIRFSAGFPVILVFDIVVIVYTVFFLK
jgi:uncharacterized membrane protein YsdA (DUF1294 family)